MKNESVFIETNERVCVNCRHYAQYYRKGEGDIRVWVPLNCGICRRSECGRKPCTAACRNFERK